MEHTFLNLLPPVVAFIINIITQVCGVRFIKKLGLFNSLVLGMGFGFISVILFEYLWLASTDGMNLDFALNLTVNILIYLCLSYNYFHFINMGETARRIRIIREIYEAPEGLHEAELLNQYNARQMVELRMGRLLSKGQVIQKDNRYYIANPTMLMISKAIVFLKILFLGKTSEFN